MKNADRVANRPTLDPLINAVLARSTVGEWCNVFQDAGVPRDWINSVADGLAGHPREPPASFRCRRGPGRHRRQARWAARAITFSTSALGAHTDEVLETGLDGVVCERSNTQGAPREE